MKNVEKTKKSLLIISLVILVIGIIFGILACHEIMFNLNKNFLDSTGLGKILSFFGTFVPVAIFIYFLLATLGVIGLIWLLYALIRLYMNSKKKKLILILIGILVFICLVIRITLYNKQNYKYLLHYNDGIDWYEIYVYDNKIKVNVEENVVCEQTSCSPQTKKFTLNFNDANTQKVNDFIDDLFLNNPYNAINIFIEQLDDNQEEIFYAIIYNDESYLD